MTSTNIARRRKNARAESGPAYAARRAEIIRAAGEVFLEKGYQATSLKDIAEQLGLDRATLYYYFSSKQELFQTATSSAVERNAHAAEGLAESGLAPTEKVSELFRRLLDSYTNLDYPYMFVFLDEDVTRIAKGAEGRRWARSVRALSDRFQDAVTRIFEQGIEAGEFESEVPPEVLTQAVIGMLDGTRRWFRPGGARSADEVARYFTHTMIHGIRRRT